MYKIREYEAIFNEELSCSIRPNDRFYLALYYIEIENYDLVQKTVGALENCSGYIPEELPILGALLNSYGRQISNPDLLPEQMSLPQPKTIETSPNISFSFELFNALIGIQRTKYLEALAGIKGSQLTYKSQNVDPLLWLTSLWTEAYLYVELNDLDSAVETYLQSIDYSREHNLPIDFGTTI